MNEINFCLDTKYEYKECLETKIDEFNKLIVGDISTSKYTIYIEESNVVIGYLICSYSWSWFNIVDLQYRDVEILNRMILALCNINKDAIGVQIKAWDKSIIYDLKEIGFDIIGSFNNMPLGEKRNVLKYLFKSGANNVKDLLVIIKNEHIDKEKLNISKNIKKLRLVSSIQNELCLIALIEEDFLGGVYGYEANDYFYLSILYINENHRDKHLGSKLLKKLEIILKTLEVKNIYLFTCSFHAPEFYRKNGYKETFIIEDEPKGYQVHAFVKEL